MKNCMFYIFIISLAMFVGFNNVFAVENDDSGMAFECGKLKNDPGGYNAKCQIYVVIDASEEKPFLAGTTLELSIVDSEYIDPNNKKAEIRYFGLDDSGPFTTISDGSIIDDFTSVSSSKPHNVKVIINSNAINIKGMATTKKALAVASVYFNYDPKYDNPYRLSFFKYDVKSVIPPSTQSQNTNVPSVTVPKISQLFVPEDRHENCTVKKDESQFPLVTCPLYANVKSNDPILQTSKDISLSSSLTEFYLGNFDMGDTKIKINNINTGDVITSTYWYVDLSLDFSVSRSDYKPNNNPSGLLHVPRLRENDELLLLINHEPTIEASVGEKVLIGTVNFRVPDIDKVKSPITIDYSIYPIDLNDSDDIINKRLFELDDMVPDSHPEFDNESGSVNSSNKNETTNESETEKNETTSNNTSDSSDDKEKNKCEIKAGKYYGPNGELLEDKAAYDKVCGSKNYKDGYGNPYVLLGFGIALIAGVITVRKKNKLFN